MAERRGLPATVAKSTDNYPYQDEPTRDFLEDETGEFLVTTGNQSGGAEVPVQIGDYKILDRVGAGGMGQVFLAEHTRMQRVVALKMLPIDRMQDARAIERFYEEIRAASRLLHPNIVTAFDAGDSEGVHYLAMEYIDGATLSQAVADQGPMSVASAASIIRQAATGLLHAHRSGIIHRDVKPSNLMKSSDGTVKVLDLGLAQFSTSNMLQQTTGKREQDAPSSKRKLVGTLAYMAPEQLEDPDKADARSDIYSLGATLYFLLTGQPPFVGDHIEQVYGHRHGTIPDLMDSRNDIDLRLNNIFRRMLAKTPAERYTSLDEVIDDLADYCSSDETPLWLAEFSPRSNSPAPDAAMRQTARVFAIDLGMHYSATAESTPDGHVKAMLAGETGTPFFRMALASTPGGQVSYGLNAIEHRQDDPRRLFHCIPLYIGKDLVDRSLAGRQCPPEVLLALLIRRITQNAWGGRTPPRSTAITVPCSYDQLHRRSITVAAQLAGLSGVRLVDRSLAATKSIFMASEDETLNEEDSSLLEQQTPPLLFLGLTGQAFEVAILRRDAGRLQQLATGGHWHASSLSWVHHLVDFAAQEFISEHKLDPRKHGLTAASLQVSCEKAVNSMLLLPKVKVSIKHGSKTLAVSISRDGWLEKCDRLFLQLEDLIDRVIQRSGVEVGSLQKIVLHGAILQIPQVRKRLMQRFSKEIKIKVVDRSDVAKGAAAWLDSELPGRSAFRQPPQGISSQTIGIVVEDVRRRRRILPIIPSGSALPARTNRKLRVGRDREYMTLSLVESSRIHGQDWHALGRYEFKIDNPNYRSRTIGFEVDVNGLLQVRAQDPRKTGSVKLASLPESELTDAAIINWKAWMDSVR